MIRKPSPDSLQRSHSTEWLRDAAITAHQVQKGGVRVAKKAGTMGQVLVLTWFGVGIGLGVLIPILSNVGQLASVGGLISSLVMLSIPGFLLWAAFRQYKKARSM